MADTLPDVPPHLLVALRHLQADNLREVTLAEEQALRRLALIGHGHAVTATGKAVLEKHTPVVFVDATVGVVTREHAGLEPMFSVTRAGLRRLSGHPSLDSAVEAMNREIRIAVPVVVRPADTSKTGGTAVPLPTVLTPTIGKPTPVTFSDGSKGEVVRVDDGQSAKMLFAARRNGLFIGTSSFTTATEAFNVADRAVTDRRLLCFDKHAPAFRAGTEVLKAGPATASADTTMGAAERAAQKPDLTRASLADLAADLHRRSMVRGELDTRLSAAADLVGVAAGKDAPTSGGYKWLWERAADIDDAVRKALQADQKESTVDAAKRVAAAVKASADAARRGEKHLEQTDHAQWYRKIRAGLGVPPGETVTGAIQAIRALLGAREGESVRDAAKRTAHVNGTPFHVAPGLWATVADLAKDTKSTGPRFSYAVKLTGNIRQGVVQITGAETVAPVGVWRDPKAVTAAEIRAVVDEQAARAGAGMVGTIAVDKGPAQQQGVECITPEDVRRAFAAQPVSICPHCGKAGTLCQRVTAWERFQVCTDAACGRSSGVERLPDPGPITAPPDPTAKAHIFGVLKLGDAGGYLNALLPVLQQMWGVLGVQSGETLFAAAQRVQSERDRLRAAEKTHNPTAQAVLREVREALGLRPDDGKSLLTAAKETQTALDDIARALRLPPGSTPRSIATAVDQAIDAFDAAGARPVDARLLDVLRVGEDHPLVKLGCAPTSPMHAGDLVAMATRAMQGWVADRTSLLMHERAAKELADARALLGATAGEPFASAFYRWRATLATKVTAALAAP